MKISDQGLDLIKEFEGFRENAYQCAAGVWTIGWGHTDGVKKGDKVSYQQAHRFLKEDVKSAENAVKIVSKKYGYSFNQQQFDALVSFTFNCGSGNLERLTQYGKRTVDQIATSFMLYINANGSPLPGLVRRRAAEKALFCSSKTDTENEKEEYYPAYVGASMNLDTIFASIGVSSQHYGNYIKRAPIAEANGISAYKGNYAQNMMLIQLAKGGRLRKL